MEGFSVVFLIVVDAVAVRSILGCDKASGSFLSGVSFEDSCYGNLDSVRPVEGVPLGVL